MKPKATEDIAEWVSFLCPCGHSGSRRVKHYEVFKCQCRRSFWAVRPKRTGPLSARPWPGLGIGIEFPVAEMARG